MMVVVDIKTGKAEKWCQLQTAGQSLLNNYDVSFNSEGHIYNHDGLVLPSITQILQSEGFIDTTWFDEWSRDKGSMVHLAVNYDIANELDESSLDPEIVPYFEAWTKFKNESGLKIEKNEIPGINTIYNYAGTPDLIGCFPTMTPVKRYALEINKLGKYKLIPFTDQNDFHIWQAAVACYHWKNNNLKRR
jgi:hypothetical protein